MDLWETTLFINQIIVAFNTAFAKQRPSHGIQNTGLAGPVGPRNTGGVDGIEIENGRFPIR
jgi:hypothetical protein